MRDCFVFITIVTKPYTNNVVRYALLSIYIKVIIPNPLYILGSNRRDAHDNMRAIN